MSFELNRGRWQVQFMEKDLQTTLPSDAEFGNS
jgi:hypothetical protein